MCLQGVPSGLGPGRVGVTLIWVFPHLAQLPNRCLCQIPISPGRIGQTVGHSKFKSMQPSPRADGTPFTDTLVKEISQKIISDGINLETMIFLSIPAIIGFARLVEAGDASESTNYWNGSRNVAHRGEQGDVLDPGWKPQSWWWRMPSDVDEPFYMLLYRSLPIFKNRISQTE